MYLTITLRKEVETQEQAQALFDVVKTKLADHPDVTINGTSATQLETLNGEPPA